MQMSRVSESSLQVFVPCAFERVEHIKMGTMNHLNNWNSLPRTYAIRFRGRHRFARRPGSAAIELAQLDSRCKPYFKCYVYLLKNYTLCDRSELRLG